MSSFTGMRTLPTTCWQKYMLLQYVNKPPFSKCVSNIAALVGMTTNLNEMEIWSALALQHPPTHNCNAWPRVQDKLWLVELKTQPWRGHTEGNVASWRQNMPWSETRLLAKGVEWGQGLAKYPSTMPANLEWSPPPQSAAVPSLQLDWSSWLGKKQGWRKWRNVGVKRDWIGARSNGWGVMWQLVLQSQEEIKYFSNANYVYSTRLFDE